MDVAAICPGCPRAGTFHSPFVVRGDGRADITRGQALLGGAWRPPSSDGVGSESQEVGDGKRLVAVDAEPAGAERPAEQVALVASLLAEEALFAGGALVHDQVAWRTTGWWWRCAPAAPVGELTMYARDANRHYWTGDPALTVDRRRAGRRAPDRGGRRAVSAT